MKRLEYVGLGKLKRSPEEFTNSQKHELFLNLRKQFPFSG
ncbi:hypothetical protein Pan153_23320 [Gimesia panareensis]|uniref:Uncharacterized protein n=1 Tax=Gimesia panareensis TaxID=2527978 RepID=A0A518FMX6_9PLAN|nr:hypothetical protein Pan153_23320 [Gimesia panareensis]